MLIIIAVLITLTAVALIPSLGVPAAVNATKLGRMSERWLAERRAAQQS